MLGGFFAHCMWRCCVVGLCCMYGWFGSVPQVRYLTWMLWPASSTGSAEQFLSQVCKTDFFWFKFICLMGVSCCSWFNQGNKADQRSARTALPVLWTETFFTQKCYLFRAFALRYFSLSRFFMCESFFA